MGSGNVCTVRLRKKLRNPEIQPAAAELSMEGGDTIKKVLWISRHEMTLEQKADLERLMGGEVELIRHWETVAELSALCFKADCRGVFRKLLVVLWVNAAPKCFGGHGEASLIKLSRGFLPVSARRRCKMYLYGRAGYLTFNYNKFHRKNQL